MTISFANRRAIVLGGSSGIGLAVAQDLTRSGCQIICAGRREQADLPLTMPQGAVYESVDVLDRAALSALFEKYAPFDFLINTATGGPRTKGPFCTMELDDFQNSFAKLWGYVNSVRLGAACLTPDGAIVLISGSPARKCAPGMIAISTVGNAVEGFVRGVAPELAPRRINAVSPGLIDTPMFAVEQTQRDAFFDAATRNNAIPRAGKPSEISQAVLFLLGNTFVTGSVVDVDGGILLP